MNVYMTEEEQLEKIRDWFKQYGLTVIISVFLAIFISLGWSYWLKKKETSLINGSNLYEELLEQVSRQDINSAKASAETLIESYDSTPYAAMAGLFLAKIDIEAGQLQDAEKQLFWVIDNAKDKGIKNIAIIRAARVLISENKAAQATDLLQRVKDKAFFSVAEAVKGDAYLSLNQKNEAKSSYEASLAAYGTQKNPNVAMVQMKLNSIS